MGEGGVCAVLAASLGFFCCLNPTKKNNAAVGLSATTREYRAQSAPRSFVRVCWYSRQAVTSLFKNGQEAFLLGKLSSKRQQ